MKRKVVQVYLDDQELADLDLIKDALGKKGRSGAVRAMVKMVVELSQIKKMK